MYVVYDTKNNTITPPAMAMDISEAQDALSEINPSNLADLVIYPLTEINELLDLFLLSIDKNKALPEFLFNSRSAEVTPSATQQAEGAVGVSDASL